MITEKIDGGPISLDSGRIRGTTTGQNDGLSVYKGIPFAEPPIGNLRWRPPVPVASWDGIRPATEFGPAAPQRLSNFGGINEKVWQSEDCLYLNIWTPAQSSDENLPVMVWIHGGGFGIGAGSVPVYWGVNLAQKGIVFVSINYRINFFGAIGHPLLTNESEHNASGNYCLMDQIEALRWIQRNIRQFGGNPECVTIFGESAGSRSVSLLTASPLAKGLFHRGICQSGALRGVSQSLEDREKEGLRLAEAVGAKTLDDLRAKSYKDFEASGSFNSNPMIDGWVIPEDPRDIYAKGEQNAVSLIVGWNADESTMMMRSDTPRTMDSFRNLVHQRYKENTAAILDLYAPESDMDIFKCENHLGTDTGFALPARNQVRWMEKKDTSSYLYQFTRVPPTLAGKRLRAHHGAEIPYVFGHIGPKWGEATDIDHQLSDAMMTYWTHFAATGDPNAKGLPEWPAYRSQSDSHMEFGDEIKPGKHLRKKQVDVLETFLA